MRSRLTIWTGCESSTGPSGVAAVTLSCRAPYFPGGTRKSACAVPNWLARPAKTRVACCLSSTRSTRRSLFGSGSPLFESSAMSRIEAFDPAAYWFWAKRRTTGTWRISETETILVRPPTSTFSRDHARSSSGRVFPTGIDAFHRPCPARVATVRPTTGLSAASTIESATSPTPDDESTAFSGTVTVSMPSR